jgi:hypothetical protein
VFTTRYALSPYIKQIRFVFKGLIPRRLFPLPRCPVTHVTTGLSVSCARRSVIFQGHLRAPLQDPLDSSSGVFHGFSPTYTACRIASQTRFRAEGVLLRDPHVQLRPSNVNTTQCKHRVTRFKCKKFLHVVLHRVFVTDA